MATNPSETTRRPAGTESRVRGITFPDRVDLPAEPILGVFTVGAAGLYSSELRERSRGVTPGR